MPSVYDVELPQYLLNELTRLVSILDAKDLIEYAHSCPNQFSGYRITI